MTEIAKILSTKYDVHVIAGEPVYDLNLEDKDLVDITIHRIRGKIVNKNNKFQRLHRAFFLMKKMVSILDKNIINVDKVLIVTNPIFLLLNVSKWCSKHDKYLAVIVHDLFPDNAINTHIIRNKLFGKFLLKKFERAYSLCNQIITCGNDMKDVLSKKLLSNKACISFIPNWANLSIIPKYATDTNKIRIQFSGNMGRVQGLEDFFDILKEIDNEDLEFAFAGNGALRDTLKERVSFLKCRVIFLPPYKRELESQVLNNCDIALVTLKDSMYGLGVPSKTYNNMASGKPILFVGPKNSDIYKEVSENSIGYAFSFSEKDKIVQFLNNLKICEKERLIEMGKKARNRAEKAYNKDLILSQYINIV